MKGATYYTCLEYFIRLLLELVNSLVSALPVVDDHVTSRTVVRRVCPVRTAPLIACNRALYRVSRTTRERSHSTLDCDL